MYSAAGLVDASRNKVMRETNCLALPQTLNEPRSQ
jgi:hypothetical protein